MLYNQILRRFSHAAVIGSADSVLDVYASPQLLPMLILRIAHYIGESVRLRLLSPLN